MEWINAALLIALLVLTAQQRQRLMRIEAHLASYKARTPSQRDRSSPERDLMTSLESILAAQKEILGSHKALVDAMKAYLDSPAPRPAAGYEKVTGVILEEKQRRELSEEKQRFEKEVREKKRTLEWYEKEFSIGLDALLELFLHVPPHVKASILSQMPNSVMKKGFRRLSDKMIEGGR